MKGTGNVIYNVCDWMMRLAIINLLWIGFSLLGVVVFGVYPASVATVSLLKEWIAGRRPSPISYFWSHYKQSFLSANLAFFAGIVLMAILALNIYISLHFDGVWFYLFFSSSIFLLVGVGFVLLLALLPLSSGENFKPAIKYAALLLLMNPVRVLALILGLVLLGICIRTVPGILPLYSINVLLLMAVYLFFISIPQKKIVNV